MEHDPSESTARVLARALHEPHIHGGGREGLINVDQGVIDEGLAELRVHDFPGSGSLGGGARVELKNVQLSTFYIGPLFLPQASGSYRVVESWQKKGDDGGQRHNGPHRLTRPRLAGGVVHQGRSARSCHRAFDAKASRGTHRVARQARFGVAAPCCRGRDHRGWRTLPRSISQGHHGCVAGRSAWPAQPFGVAGGKGAPEAARVSR